jgi:hypothetical protein
LRKFISGIGRKTSVTKRFYAAEGGIVSARLEIGANDWITSIFSDIFGSGAIIAAPKWLEEFG